MTPPLTVKQTAAHLDCDEEIILDAIEKGILHAANIGRGKIPRWRITEDQITDYLERCTRIKRTKAPPCKRLPKALSIV